MRLIPINVRMSREITTILNWIEKETRRKTKYVWVKD